MGFKINKLRSIFLSLFYLGLFSNLNSIAQDNFLSNSEGSSIQAENSDINKLDNFGDIRKNFYLIGPGDILELTLLDAPEFSGEYNKQIDTGTATNNQSSSFSFNFFEGKAKK